MLARAGATVAATGPDALTVSGLTSQSVVHASRRPRSPVHRGVRALRHPGGGVHGTDQERCRIPRRGRTVRGRAMTSRHHHPVSLVRSAGYDGFAQLLRAEWTKFRTVRGWVIGMMVAGLLIAGGRSARGPGQHRVPPVARPAPVRHGAACVMPVPMGPGGEPVTDSFYFVHQPLAGNGSITVRVTSLTGLPSPRHGRRLGTRRRRTASGAAAVVQGRDHHQAEHEARLGVRRDDGHRRPRRAHAVRLHQDIAGLPGKVSAASPRWLRLTRSGDTITGYDSADGAHWTGSAPPDLAGLPSTVQAGLFATSPPYCSELSPSAVGHGSGTARLATGVFDHVGRPGASGRHVDRRRRGASAAGPQRPRR